MNKNDLGDLREQAISQFFGNYEAQGSPSDRAQYIAEETADVCAPIHYSSMADLMGQPYGNLDNMLLHLDVNIDHISGDKSLMEIAQITVVDWLVKEIMDEFESRSQEINYEHRLIFETEEEVTQARVYVIHDLENDVLEDSDDYDPDSNTYEFTFATYAKINNRELTMLIQHTKPAQYSVNREYNG